jgi:predicted ester cyclase
VGAAAARWRAAFPDLHFDVRLLIAEGDKVAAYVPFSGTHTGRLWNIEPTGKFVRVDETIIFSISDDKIVQAWDVLDELIMRQQMGALPAPAEH